MAHIMQRLETDGAVTPDDVGALSDAMLQAGRDTFPGDPAFERVASASMDMLRSTQLDQLRSAGLLHAPIPATAQTGYSDDE